jgi:hypothetical protein
MQRDESVAITILRTILFLDSDGEGYYRKDFYSAVRQILEMTVGESELVNMVDYHLHLLETAGFVLCDPELEGGHGLDSFLLTWRGHDYLDSKLI